MSYEIERWLFALCSLLMAQSEFNLLVNVYKKKMIA